MQSYLSHAYNLTPTHREKNSIIIIIIIVLYKIMINSNNKNLKINTQTHTYTQTPLMLFINHHPHSNNRRRIAIYSLQHNSLHQHKARPDTTSVSATSTLGNQFLYSHTICHSLPLCILSNMSSDDSSNGRHSLGDTCTCFCISTNEGCSYILE